ncbi:MAG: hypothetical protein FJX54_06680 [Alphaproteobacteria bacterium]|nr:hypothetical protein [Alphaproteobacteria bacterium]
MIGEALAWLATPCPFYVRRLGLLTESIAISARHRRCRAAWAPHLAATRQVILDAIARTPRRRTALVMGSGALLDVPLEELADAFERVLLVDLVHPWTARLKTRHLPQVMHVTDDVTGTLEAVARGELVRPRPFPLLADPEVDLAVSLNLLSQIPVVPVRRLDGRIDDARLAAAAQNLVKSHLADFDRSRAATLLVSDVERVVTDRNGQEIERASLIADLAEPRADREWWWDIAPAPEIDSNSSERRRVVARFVPGAFGGESL